MKLTENFISQNTAIKSYNWGEGYKLKHKYESIHNNEVKTYKLTPEELEEYLKKFK